MPLPANLSTGTVVGTFLDSGGRAVAGVALLFTPAVSRITDGVNTVDLTPISVSSGTAGTFSVVLPATNDADYAPINWTYRVTGSSPTGERFDFSFALAGGTTVNIASVPEAFGSSGYTLPAPPSTLIDVRKYGYDTAATGAVNAAAIQSALNEASGLRGIWIPPIGPCTVDGPRTGTFNAMFTYVSGTEVYGGGDQSCLKVANGYTAGGNYNIFAPATATTTNNVLFHRFKIDGNAANNIVLGGTGPDVRQAISIYCYAGTNVTIDDVTVTNNPGRNVFALGGNINPVSITNGRVTNCRISNVGGGITGNELQNDCSTIYTQFDRGVVGWNDISNPAPFDPNTPTPRTVLGMEIHGSRTLVVGNRVTNLTHGGNAVASIADSIGNTWTGNTFTNLTRVGINLWAVVGFTHANLSITDNVMRFETSYNLVTAGIYEYNTSAAVGAQIRNLTIARNVIESDSTTLISSAWHGVYLTSIDGARVINNVFRNTSGPGVTLDGHSEAALNVERVEICDNQIYNAGFHTVANRQYAILLINAGTFGSQFKNIRIVDNRITKPTSAGTARGINVQGAGRIEDVTIDGRGLVENMAAFNQLATITATDVVRCFVLPKTETIATATSPTTGIWTIGDQILHTDVASAGFLGKVCTTAGGATSATWGVATAYAKGVWIKTSTNKILECIVAGTSSGAEPAPVTLGDPVVDNTVTWAYRHTANPVFKTFGVVS